MSIIRDFIEYYRLPEEIKSNLLDFEVKHTLLNGSENRYYYSTIEPDMYIMLVDMFTSDGTRYHRKIFTYGTDFRIIDIVHEYDFGKKRRSDLFEYGSGVTDGAIIRMDTEEHDVDITWDDPEPSTGWPNYDMGVGGINSIVAGNNITIDNTDPKNPIVSMDTDFLLKQEFYDTLEFYGLAKIDWFTYVPDKYGSSSIIPTNNSVQYYTIPVMPEDSIIKAHCWGAGGGATGGYTYGEFVVKTLGTTFNPANPSHVYSGMVLCIHVGEYRGRAAIWRNTSPNYSVFNAYNSEIMVAGGGGGGGVGVAGGYGGGLNGGNGVTHQVLWATEGTVTSNGGGGGTQSAGGVVGSISGGYDGINGSAGIRIWGGSGGHPSYGSGGDGYYGGGGTGATNYTNPDSGSSGICSGGGGAGSGYFHPSLQGAFTENPTTLNPPHTSDIAYGLNAGFAGNPGRVAFVLTL